MDAVQRIVVLPEVRDLLHVRRADQPPVEIVGPRVIRTLDAAGERPLELGAQPGAAMTADVVERVDAPGRRARDDDALAEELADEELARADRPARSRPAQTHIRPNRPPSPRLKYAAIDVVRGRQRSRARRHHVARLDVSGSWLLQVHQGSSVSSRASRGLRNHDTAVRLDLIDPSAAWRAPRELGRWDLTAIGVNQVIGAAVFAHAGGAGRERRRVEPVDGRRRRRRVDADRALVRRSGEPLRRHRRPYLYTRAAFGRFAAFEVGWMLWFTRAASWASVINVLVASLGFYWPAVTVGRRATIASSPRSSPSSPRSTSAASARAARGQRADGRQARCRSRCSSPPGCSTWTGPACARRRQRAARASCRRAGCCWSSRSAATRSSRLPAGETTRSAARRAVRADHDDRRRHARA